MAGSDSQPKKATPPKPAANAPRKPLQVMHISRKAEEEITNKEVSDQTKDKRFDEKVLDEKNIPELNKYHEQKGKCSITGHNMTHIVDNKLFYIRFGANFCNCFRYISMNFHKFLFSCLIKNAN